MLRLSPSCFACHYFSLSADLLLSANAPILHNDDSILLLISGIFPFEKSLCFCGDGWLCVFTVHMLQCRKEKILKLIDGGACTEHCSSTSTVLCLMVAAVAVLGTESKRQLRFIRASLCNLVNSIGKRHKHRFDFCFCFISFHIVSTAAVCNCEHV